MQVLYLETLNNHTFVPDAVFSYFVLLYFIIIFLQDLLLYLFMISYLFIALYVK